MKRPCPSHKKTFSTQEIAEDILIELWSKNEYQHGHAPIAVYKCDDCGGYHLTSHGTMNDRLADHLSSGKMKLMKEANRWLEKFKRK